MPRHMSVAETEAAVRARTKTETRRLGWWKDKRGRRLLKPGDLLVLCPKVMGRRRPDGIVLPLDRIVTVEVTSVHREPLCMIDEAGVAAEGVPVDGRFEDVFADTGQPPPSAWVSWYCEAFGCTPYDDVTVIKWRYLDA